MSPSASEYLADLVERQIDEIFWADPGILRAAYNAARRQAVTIRDGRLLYITGKASRALDYLAEVAGAEIALLWLKSQGIAVSAPAERKAEAALLFA